MFEWLSLLAGHYWSIVKHIENVASLLCQNDLLLRTFDDRCGVDIVSLLELLPGDVCKLRFRDQGLSLGAD